MGSTPAVWKQYNKMVVLHFFSSKFPSNKYSILFAFSPPLTGVLCFMSLFFLKHFRGEAFP